MIDRTNYLQENKILEISKLLELIREEDDNCFQSMEKVLNEFKPKLIMNKVRRRSQISEGNQLITLAKDYLKISVDYLGHVEVDQRVVDSAEKMMPFVLEYPKCSASKNLFEIVKKIISINKAKDKSFRRFKKDMKTEARQWQ